MKQTKPSILELRSLSPVFAGRQEARDDARCRVTLLSAQESKAWLKRHRSAHQSHTSRQYRVLWPEDPKDVQVRKQLAARLASLSDWVGAVLVITFGAPRESGLEQVRAIRARQSTAPHASDLPGFPGQLFDEDASRNQANVEVLLAAMFDGYVEGTLATKGGRFVAVVGCGIIECHTIDKSLGGKLRAVVGDLRLETIPS